MYMYILQHPKETEYKFATPSTMKPTQITCSEGSINQIPPWTEVKGKFLVAQISIIVTSNLNIICYTNL